MMVQHLAAWLARRGIHYGWVVAGTTFLIMLATAGAMGSAGVMIEPLKTEFGWTTEQVSTAFAVRMVIFGFFGPFAAAFMNRFGLRPVVGVALTLICAGIIASWFMTTPGQLVLLWGVVIGTGTGLTALVLAATVATRWFVARRGLVVGILSASNATGQLAFLPLLASITASHGWRAALGLTVVVLAIALVLALIFLRDYPSDVGLPALGETQVMPPPQQSHGLRQLLTAPLVTLAEAARTGTFWVIFLTFFICGLSTNGLIQTHWISICGDFGIAAVAAAWMLAVIGIFDLAGTIGSGWLSDRFDNRWLLFWYYGLRGLSLIYLSYSGFGMYQLGIFAIFYGLDWFATVPPTVKLTAERFGREKAGMVFGWIFAGHQLGAATAAFGAGAIRTDFATYLPALLIAGLMCVIAALSVMMLSRPAPKLSVA